MRMNNLVFNSAVLICFAPLYSFAQDAQPIAAKDNQVIVTGQRKDIVDKIEPADGYNIGWNVNKTGGQNVAHAHLHLLARYNDEPLAGKGIRHAFKQPENQRPQS